MALSLQISKFNIENYLKSHGIDFDDRHPGYFTIKTCVNPDCRKENKLILNREEKYFTCFVCEIRGSLIDFISLVDGIERHEAIKKILGQKTFIQSNPLAKKIHLNNNYNVDIDSIVQSNIDEYQSSYPFSDINLKDGTIQSQYLLNRGFNQDCIDLNNIKYCESLKRIIFLVYDHLNRCVGWQGRDITDESEIKTLTKPNGLKKALLLYNYNQFLDEDMITLVEGPVDAVKCQNYNAVALFGKKISEFQKSLLFHNINLKKVVVGLDLDASHEALLLANELKDFYDVYVIDNYGSKKDFGACSFEEVDKIFENLKPFSHEKKLIGLG